MLFHKYLLYVYKLLITATFIQMYNFRFLALLSCFLICFAHL